MLTKNFQKFITSTPILTKSSYHLYEGRRHRRYIPVYLPIIKPRKIKREALKATQKSKYTSREISETICNKSNDIEPNNQQCNITYFTPGKALELLRLFHKSLPVDEQSQTGYVALNMVLKVDTSRTSIRGSVLMPHPIGTVPKVLAICDPADEKLAISNGAKYAGLDIYIDKIASGWLDFDRLVCTPQYMPKLLRVARILGPAKLMPTFKSGTLVTNLTEALQILTSSNSLQYRAENVDTGNLASIGLPNSPHGELTVSIGMLSHSDMMLLENIAFLVKEVAKKRPVENIRKSNSTNFLDWPPTNFISPRQKESRHTKLERYIKLLELSN